MQGARGGRLGHDSDCDPTTKISRMVAPNFGGPPTALKETTLLPSIEETPERIIAIGDIHGCDVALERLVEAISIQPKDTLVGLGDYVDRGPNSRGVIDRLLQLETVCRAHFLTGNHELMMQAAIQGQSETALWLANGGAQTVQSYGGSLANTPEEHLDFLNRCVPFFETTHYFFVHANYSPHLPLEKQPAFSLYWEHLHAYTPTPHMNGKIAVVGHTPQRSGNVLQLAHLICLDTYCYGRGWLSAMELNSGQIWQANNKGEIR